MKRLFYLFSMLIIFLFLSCASTIKVVRADCDSVLKKNEGYVVLRIINPTANKIMDDFFDVNGNRREGIEPMHLNSDLTIKKAPFSFSELFVANSESNQIVVLKAKKGTYGITKVGKNTEYFNPYAFKVLPGVVNYAGDIKIDMVQGRYVFVWNKIRDYYDLSVEDNFIEIKALKTNSAVLNCCSEYEFVNQAKITEKMKPLFCEVKRIE